MGAPRASPAILGNTDWGDGQDSPQTPACAAPTEHSCAQSLRKPRLPWSLLSRHLAELGWVPSGQREGLEPRSGQTASPLTEDLLLTSEGVLGAHGGAEGLLGKLSSAA